MSRQIRHVLNMRVHAGVLNDVINHAQKGCAVQMCGITLRRISFLKIPIIVSGTFMLLVFFQTRIYLLRFKIAEPNP